MTEREHDRDAAMRRQISRPDDGTTARTPKEINVLGAGLAGLSAAITLAESGIACRLISAAPSERAQSVLAEGGINAALDHYGENDTPAEHMADTLKGGVYLANREAVRGLCEAAPDIISRLAHLGVPFHVREDGRIAQRYFGGQKKRRTAYVGSLTGKMLMSALIDEARKHEAAGRITRYDHHVFVRLLTDSARRCTGVRAEDTRTHSLIDFGGPVILASGGMNGMFPGKTTGTTHNTGDVTATVLAQGVALSNLEMIQYHPTTIAIPGKRMLVTEAARGEGGRLYVARDTRAGEDKNKAASGESGRYYFMEDRYPALGNLMPRDVVSREIYRVLHDDAYGDQVYLDMTALSAKIWQERLSELREEIRAYLSVDPAKEPVPVSPGIHYFMGGIDVDVRHRTNMEGLYAAGECCSLYHGANRLGGNSTMGAIHGGRVAAHTALETLRKARDEAGGGSFTGPVNESPGTAKTVPDEIPEEASASFNERLGAVLYGGLGIVRDEDTMRRALSSATLLQEEASNGREKNRILLAQAMLHSALARKESRGAHFRSDFPEVSDIAYAVRVVYNETGLQCQNVSVNFINEK